MNIHTDTLNESGFVEHSIAAFKDRTIHTYHRYKIPLGHVWLSLVKKMEMMHSRLTSMGITILVQ